MLFQAGAPVTADLFGPALAGQTVLLPKTLHAFAADAKTPANFAGAFPALPRSDDPLSQILTQRPHNFPFMKGRIAGFTRYVYLNRKCSILIFLTNNLPKQSEGLKELRPCRHKKNMKLIIVPLSIFSLSMRRISRFQQSSL